MLFTYPKALAVMMCKLTTRMLLMSLIFYGKNNRRPPCPVKTHIPPILKSSQTIILLSMPPSDVRNSTIVKRTDVHDACRLHHGYKPYT